MMKFFVFLTIILYVESRNLDKRAKGSAVATEDVGTDKPPMPAALFMKLTNEHDSKAKANDRNVAPSSHRTKTETGEKVVAVGDGSIDLNRRQETVTASGFKPGTVGGTHSETNWKGKTENAHGRTVAVGPGTFTFGNKPTGTLAQKEH